MRSRGPSMRTIAIFAGIGIGVFVLIFAGLSLTRNLGKSSSTVSLEKAISTMNNLYGEISVKNVEARKDKLEFEAVTLKDALPSIKKYPPQVDNTTDAYVEIFSSTEKAGSGMDGWLTEVAGKFNGEGFTVGGKTVSVRLRGIASGLGFDYISSGKYIPDAFTPSNELWGAMLESSGTDIELVEKRLTGNVAGILLSKEKQAELVGKYGAININTIVEAVAKNEINMGYTNPFASSTGLNFLISTLNTIDSADILSDAAVAGFERFQTNIPFVAYTTLQMRDAASSGVLDGFILEYQTYENLPDLKRSYVFTPFGVRHDSPVYSLGKLSSEKRQILAKFVEYCKKENNQQLAYKYGFNRLDTYGDEMGKIDGQKIIQAQKLWKEKKNVNKPISAVFVADTSGSMQGEPINKLKQSLLSGAENIDRENSIGLVSFSNDVNINLPLAKFDLNQRAFFSGAVKDLEAGGGTAMYDGIIVAAKLLMDEKAKSPDTKIMMFVLTDGETNRGHSLDDVRTMLDAMEIPVYTIGYNANIEVLKTISSINEAANINADSDDVVYKIMSLFNSEM